jgi:hypothetical protein
MLLLRKEFETATRSAVPKGSTSVLGSMLSGGKGNTRGGLESGSKGRARMAKSRGQPIEADECGVDGRRRPPNPQLLGAKFGKFTQGTARPPPTGLCWLLRGGCGSNCAVSRLAPNKAPLWKKDMLASSHKEATSPLPNFQVLVLYLEFLDTQASL